MRFISLILLSVAVCLGLSGVARGAIMSSGGPNPNWTDMQKYEWYIGYVARASQICGAHVEAAVLNRLARMSPYGSIGYGQRRGDGFLRNACLRITEDAKEMVADAERIEAYIEATYNCSDDGCFGQKLSDWQFHACAETLKEHFSVRDLDSKDIREVTISDVKKAASIDHHQARVRFKSCQGSLYIDLKQSCTVEKEYTRGDCEISGVESY
jgi:hypothetical protein